MKLLKPSNDARGRGRRSADTALAFLSELAGELPVVANLQDLLSYLIRTCRAELGFDSCSLALLDDDGDALRIRAASGLRTPYIDLKIPAGQGLHGEVMRTGQPLRVGDMAADNRIYQLHPGIRSAIYAPLVAGGRVIGVLSALRAAKDAFTTAELNLLTVVAGYVAGAVEVARLHDRLREQALNSTHLLTAALDLVSVAIVIAELEDGTILRWNRAAADIYGYDAAEIIGQPITMLEPLDMRGALGEVLASLRRGDPARSVDAVHLTKDGLRRHVVLTAHPMRNTAGQVRWALLDVMGY